MVQISNAENAKKYFTDGLSKGDYYLDDQELSGEIKGKLAERLGISGIATKEVFYSLCDNVNPKTGQPLTPRFKENRTVGYDVNFHCPKSVSIAHTLSQDFHILEAFESAVSETMADIEADAKTRVRANGKDEDRDTNEMIWGQFIHQTARPADNLPPDPHLHLHAVLLNLTMDPVENRLKAAQFRYIKRDMPYYQAKFHKRLSDNLIAQGYQVERTKNSFELKGIPKHVIKHFSKRTNEIGRIAQEKNVTDPKALDQLGARTRAKKDKGLSMRELKQEWKRQIRELGQEKEGEGDKAVRFDATKETQRYSAKDCVDHAIGHEFERASVKQERRLKAAAYQHAIGDAYTPIETVDREFANDRRLLRVKDGNETLCTTREILAEEHKMIKLARQMQGKALPLYLNPPPMKLESEQRDAVEHILTTTDRISIIRGAAGTGKTTLMKEAISHIEKAGKKVITVAPTAKAARGVLRDDGFKDAQTVSKLLQDEKLRASLKNQVLWVDEAGLLGNKEMISLLELASQSNARVVLGGDTRQHNSVQRGDALRILSTVGKISSAEVTKIFRQKDEKYRHTVDLLSKGEVKEAFVNLEEMKAIIEVEPERPVEQITDDYLSAKRLGRSGIIVSPTHEQGDVITDTIREKMKARGMLGKKDVSLRKLTNLNLTTDQKADWRNLEKDQIVQFNQHSPGIKRGSQWKVLESSEKDVLLTNDAQETVSLPRNRAKDYDVLIEQKIAIAKGDTIRVTRNGFDKAKKEVSNGQMFQVAKVHKNGDLEIRNGKSKVSHRIDKDFGHIAHGHCVTSHSSQGMTVDDVFISVPASTFKAANMKQMYVSVSRGRDRARIYTDDKVELQKHAEKDGDRQSATELMAVRDANDSVRQQIREQIIRNEIGKPVPTKETAIAKRKVRSYEPGI